MRRMRDFVEVAAEAITLMVESAIRYFGNAYCMLFMGPPYYETTCHAHIDRTGGMRAYLNMTMRQRVISAITGRR